MGRVPLFIRSCVACIDQWNVLSHGMIVAISIDVILSTPFHLKNMVRFSNGCEETLTLNSSEGFYGLYSKCSEDPLGAAWSGGFYHIDVSYFRDHNGLLILKGIFIAYALFVFLLLPIA